MPEQIQLPEIKRERRKFFLAHWGAEDRETWVTSDGTVYRICDMTDAHIYRSLVFLEVARRKNNFQAPVYDVFPIWEELFQELTNRQRQQVVPRTITTDESVDFSRFIE